jgi:branched-chain amino acid transport system substrate-binding protein
MRMRKRIFLSIIFAALIASCAKEERVIKIGVAGPLTGDQAKVGQDMRNGVLLAVEDANSRGGILGMKVKIVEMDDRHDPKEAVSVAQKLVADKDVVGVIGHLNSGCCIPASDVYRMAGMAMITPSATNPEVTRRQLSPDWGPKNVFRVCLTDDVQGELAGKFAIERLKVKTAAVIHDKSAYGKGIAMEFEKAFRRYGGKVLTVEGITQGDEDFSAVLTKIKGMNPDLIYFGGMFREGGLIVRQAKALGIRAIYMGADGLYTPEYIRIGGQASEGSIMSFLAPPWDKFESVRDFIRRYNERFGEIQTYAPYAYDAANVLMEAIKRAGTTDRRKVSEEVARTKGFKGITGTITFDEKGDNVNKRVYFYKVSGGKFVLF